MLIDPGMKNSLNDGRDPTGPLYSHSTTVGAGLLLRALADRHRMTFAHQRFVALALALLLTGCAHRLATSQQGGSEDKPAGARLGRTEAIEIAKRTAERFGAKLSEQAEPTADYQTTTNRMIVWATVVEGPGESSFGDHIWVVHFGWGPKRNYPGGDFFVFVDDKTGRSRLVGGM